MATKTSRPQQPPAREKTQNWKQHLSRLNTHTDSTRRDRRFKMLCSRCVLPLLAFYLLLEEMSAFVLPKRFRKRRDVNWPDQELFPHLPGELEQGDLSVGDAGDMSRDRDAEGRPSHSAAFLTPLEHLPVQRHGHQRQHHRKNSNKRRKVAPLDSIGSSLMSSSRNRKDEPDVYWDDYSD